MYENGLGNVGKFFKTQVGAEKVSFVGMQGEIKPFKSFKHRFPIPYPASNSTSPLWYSIKRGSAHIIVLSSYSAYGEEQ